MIIRSHADGTVKVAVKRSCVKETPCAHGIVLGTLTNDSSGISTIMSLAGMDNDIGENVATALEELLAKAFELGMNEAEQIGKLTSPTYPPP
ncbi:MAG: hypothetical protein P1P90_01605 [Patescibacteria group bacterium]|nr:hypothetical protein [Patescibacteria group bacterium]